MGKHETCHICRTYYCLKPAHNGEQHPIAFVLSEPFPHAGRNPVLQIHELVLIKAISTLRVFSIIAAVFPTLEWLRLSTNPRCGIGLAATYSLSTA